MRRYYYMAQKDDVPDAAAVGTLVCTMVSAIFYLYVEMSKWGAENQSLPTAEIQFSRIWCLKLNGVFKMWINDVVKLINNYTS